MGTQRIIVLIGLLVVVVGGIFYFRPRRATVPVLHFITWSNYYPDDLIAEFTKETGIKVELSYISSNEELFAKYKAGASGFDLIQPSDYMVRQMSQLDMLQPIDPRLLSNLSNLDEFYRNLPYDPGLKYSIPFTWGTTGLAIDTESVKVPSGGVSWKMLFESPDFKHTSLLDDMREVFGAALLYRGHSLNSHDEGELLAAKKDIGSIKPKILMFSSEPRPLLQGGEVRIAHAYSVDGVQAHVDNPKIEYFIPIEGGTLWTDNFSIPKSGHRTLEAHKFIDFFLDPKNASRLAIQNHLATPNKVARDMLPADQKNNPNLYPPPEVMKRLQLLDDPGETLNAINRMWTEIKS